MPVRATPDTIWQVPAYLPYVQPPLTQDAIAAAEHKIGYRLPSEFLALLKTQNGGYIRFSLPDMVHDSIAGIGPNFPSLTEFDWSDSQEYVGFTLHGLVPFDGEGHWHLCLDYRANAATPSITYVDVECDEQSRIADSFADYLTLLRLDIDGEYVLTGVCDIESVKSRLEALLNSSFDPPDSWAHGYPMHRAGLGTSDNPDWVWISPNTVARGFVRPEDARYTELKNLMPGHADRFPGLPAHSYLLSATDGARTKVIEACARCGLRVRPLLEYLNGI